MKGRVWINFKELRARLKFEDVLRHYNVEVVRKGQQHLGPCPLPGHDPRMRAPSFSANLDRGIFQCFGCGAKGNVLEFAALMDRANVEDGDALREVAVRLQERFFPGGASTRKREPSPLPAPSLPTTGSVVVNGPLDFELKGLDWGHESLARRGFAVETMRHFGVGFCSRGLLKDRVAIPLHDHEGRLVGYAGDAVDDSGYLFPSRRERNGTAFEFDPSLLVYNLHRVKVPCEEVIIVADFPSVWWLHQNGFRNAVSLVGDTTSDRQIELILGLLSPSGRAWVAPGDEGLATSLVSRLSPHRFVRWVKQEKREQLSALSAHDLKTCFTM